jgi:hypothetical protein
MSNDEVREADFTTYSATPGRLTIYDPFDLAQDRFAIVDFSEAAATRNSQ